MRSCQDMRNPTADRRSDEETTRRATTISPLPPSFLSTTRRVYVRIGRLFNDHVFRPLLGCPRRGMVVVERSRWSYIIPRVLNFLTRARLSSVASNRRLDREWFVNIAFSESHLAIFLVVEFDFVFFLFLIYGRIPLIVLIRESEAFAVINFPRFFWTKFVKVTRQR